MDIKINSLRPFIGSKNFAESRAFYQDLGFKESIISGNMSYFMIEKHIGFYLQDAYVKEWIENSMLFLEVENVNLYFENLQKLSLDKKYLAVKFSPIKNLDWGKEGFMHDPSGVLWHFGEFH